MAGKNALETAAGILSLRAYTKLELRRKLYRKEKFQGREIEQAVAELERMGFLSDQRYCEDAVRIMRNRGYGNIRIRSKLLTKGIPREMLDSVLNDPETAESGDDVSRAVELLRKNGSRFGREEDIRKRKAKALRFLGGRGFSAPQAYQALEQWMNGTDDEEEIF